MVFEEIFKIDWIERKWYAFFLGVVCTIVGLITAKLIFPSSTGLMSIYFTSILLIPSLAKMLKNQEKTETEEKEFSMKTVFKDHQAIFKTYMLLFLGIFFAYSMMTILLPLPLIQKMFATQLKVAGLTGFATNSDALFLSIVHNNLIVFVACLALSLFYGAGAVVFLTWNASVWGIVFSYFIVQSAIAENANSLFYFFKNIGPFLPHMITEGFSYVGAAIVGGVMSNDFLSEKLFSKNFFKVAKDSAFLLGVCFLVVIIAGVLEVYVY